MTSMEEMFKQRSKLEVLKKIVHSTLVKNKWLGKVTYSVKYEYLIITPSTFRDYYKISNLEVVKRYKIFVRIPKDYSEMTQEEIDLIVFQGKIIEMGIPIINVNVL